VKIRDAAPTPASTAGRTIAGSELVELARNWWPEYIAAHLADVELMSSTYYEPIDSDSGSRI